MGNSNTSRIQPVLIHPIINKKLSVIASGYIRESSAYLGNNEFVNHLVLKYYLTFNANSCYDNTFDGLYMTPQQIAEFLIKLSTKQYGSNSCDEIIKIFKSFAEPGKSWKTKHYKVYLSCMNDLLSFFIDQMQTDDIIQLITFLKNIILTDQWYEGKNVHSICSEFVANLLNIHLSDSSINDNDRNLLIENVFDFEIEIEDIKLFTYLGIIKDLNINKEIFEEIIISFLCCEYDEILSNVYIAMKEDDYDRSLAFVSLLKLIEYKSIDLAVNASTLLSKIMDIIKTDYEENYAPDSIAHAISSMNMCRLDNIDYAFQCLQAILSNINVDIKQRMMNNNEENNIFSKIHNFLFRKDSWLQKDEGIEEGIYFAFKFFDEYLRIKIESNQNEENKSIDINSYNELIVGMRKCMNSVINDYKRACTYNYYSDNVQKLCQNVLEIGLSVGLKLKKVAELNKMDLNETLFLFITDIIKCLNMDKQTFCYNIIETLLHWNYGEILSNICESIKSHQTEKSLSFVLLLKLIKYKAIDLSVNTSTLLSIIMNSIKLDSQQNNGCSNLENIEYAFDCLQAIFSNINTDLKRQLINDDGNIFNGICDFLYCKEEWLQKVEMRNTYYFAYKCLNECLQIKSEHIAETTNEMNMNMNMSQEKTEKLVIAMRTFLKSVIWDYKKGRYDENVQKRCKMIFEIVISATLKLKKVSELSQIGIKKINGLITQFKKTKVFQNLELLNDIE